MRPSDDRRDRVFILGIEEFALCYLPTTRRIVSRVVVAPRVPRQTTERRATTARELRDSERPQNPPS